MARRLKFEGEDRRLGWLAAAWSGQACQLLAIWEFEGMEACLGGEMVPEPPERSSNSICETCIWHGPWPTTPSGSRRGTRAETDLLNSQPWSVWMRSAGELSRDALSGRHRSLMNLLGMLCLVRLGKLVQALVSSVIVLARCTEVETQLKSIKCTLGRRWRGKLARVRLPPAPLRGTPRRPRPRPTPGTGAHCAASLTMVVN